MSLWQVRLLLLHEFILLVPIKQFTFTYFNISFSVVQGLTDIAWKDTTCSLATFSIKLGTVTVTINWRPICKQEQKTTSESMDALSDLLDFLMENAPVAAAVGGVAASTALVANPSLPMTGSNGVPPGIY